MKTWHWYALIGLGIVAIVTLNRQSRDVITQAAGSIMNLASRLVATFEGYKDEPYQDEAGIWTIGYGHVIRAGEIYWHPDYNPEGLRKITQEQAADQLAADMFDAETSVNNRVTVPLTEPQHAALVSLVFNIGDGNFSSSTLLARLNSGDYQGAADQFPVWNKVRNPATNQLVVSNGLSNRRAQEQQVFLQA